MKTLVKYFSIIFVLCLIILLSSFLVESASEDETFGWAWSSTIGWISFNCADRSICGTSDYKVEIESGGNLIGYGWSENIGWIDFDPSAPYPSLPNQSAKYNSGTDKIAGWAKALAYGGGWDGWILLGKNSGGWLDQVIINDSTNEFEQWAWGSDIVGWISFNCEDMGACVITTLNYPPTVSCNDSEAWFYCIDSRHPTLQWIYSDPDSDPQGSYYMEIDNNSNFSSPLDYTSLNRWIDSSSYSFPTTGISFNWDERYYWRLKVRDDQGGESDWSSSCDFNTPIHAHPDPDFTWIPNRPLIEENVQFTDQTTYYGGSSGSIWLWTFENGDPSVSASESPETIFDSSGQKAISLTVTDSSGFSCDANDILNVSFPLPKWKEVRP